MSLSTLSNPTIGMTMQVAAQSVVGVNPANSTVQHSHQHTPIVGNVTGDINKCGDKQFTIASSGAALSIDLMSLTDPNTGSAVTLSTLNQLMISNLSTVAATATASDLSLSTAVTLGASGLGFTGVPILGGKGDFTPGALCLDLGPVGIAVDSTHKIIEISTPAGTNVVGRATFWGK